jgi:hypothetical protein
VYEDEQASIDKKPRTFGLHKGMIEMSDDFDEPLPDILWLGNEA